MHGAGLAVTSVINNTGFGTFGPFTTENADRLRQQIAVDVSAVVDNSRAVAACCPAPKPPAW
ncbi:hypothetical protein GCM10009741_75750 [Kribbella lupini]|uniref:Uncharacterized protein n=1 Tax=Kribbella lupini TaxID=291602 RepID=A0ABP4NCC6_9ACTN